MGTKEGRAIWSTTSQISNFNTSTQPPACWGEMSNDHTNGVGHQDLEFPVSQSTSLPLVRRRSEAEGRAFLTDHHALCRQRCRDQELGHIFDDLREISHKGTKTQKTRKIYCYNDLKIPLSRFVSSFFFPPARTPGLNDDVL